MESSTEVIEGEPKGALTRRGFIGRTTTAAALAGTLGQEPSRRRPRSRSRRRCAPGLRAGTAGRYPQHHRARPADLVARTAPQRLARHAPEVDDPTLSNDPLVHEVHVA